MRRARSRSPARDFSRLEYDRRVNRVIDHIRAHLDEPLTLEGLARLAAFSPFHFGRVFKAMTGETLFEFVHRVRIEGAARALLARPGQSVLEIALDHGFSSAAAFARAFRERFDMSATEWRAAHHRNSGTQVRNARKAGPRAGSHTSRKRAGEEPAMSIRVTELPPYHVAYMRYVGPYGAHGIPELWQRFGKWMHAHGIAGAGRITIGIGYDDPRITAAEKCRYDACVVVAPDFRPDRLVDVTDLAGGAHAVWEFAGTAHEIVGAWDQVFSAWLPGSGWAPDDRPCLEVYRGAPGADHRPGAFRCDLCLPVRPL